MKKAAVLLAGSGVFDGSEINESAYTLLALSKYNVEYQCYAPNRDQYDVIDHTTKEEKNNAKRNILVESARIARGKILPLDQLNMDNCSSLLIPGGIGLSKNFCNLAVKKENFEVHGDIETAIVSCFDQKKYIGAICFAPIILSKIFFDKKPSLTLGKNDRCKKMSEDLGFKFQMKKSSEICIDEKHKIVTTSAFMNDASNYDVYLGIDNLVKYISENSEDIKSAFTSKSQPSAA